LTDQPKETRELAVAHQLEHAEKFRALQKLIVEGLDDIKAGRVMAWSLRDFLRAARRQK
jgi:hypothetical protein